jgi:hypothetical protein
MELRKKIQYTLGDYIAFNFFYLKKRLIWIPVLLVIGFPAVTLVSDLLQGDTAWLMMLLATLVIAVVLAGLMTLINILSVRHAAKKQYQSSRAMQAGSDLLVDDTGVYESSEFGSSVIKWEDVYKAAESDTAVYIFSSRLQAFLIPKRLITQAEDSTLRALIQNHLPPEKVKLRRTV